MTQTSLFARWSDHQLSRIEVVFAIIVILILVSVFLSQMFVVMARAERTLVETSVIRINSALQMYRFQSDLENNSERVNAMQHANPIRLLEQISGSDISAVSPSNQLAALLRVSSRIKLPNYAGELDDANVVELLESGSWYFDLKDRSLVYIIRSSANFRSELSGLARLRYQLQLAYTDQNEDGRYNSDIDDFISVSLQSMDEHKWLL